MAAARKGITSSKQGNFATGLDEMSELRPVVVLPVPLTPTIETTVRGIGVEGQTRLV